MRLAGPLTPLRTALLLGALTTLGACNERPLTGPTAKPLDGPGKTITGATGSNLGSLGGSSTQAEAMSADGQVTGWSNLSGDQQQHAFRWTAATGMQDIGTLGGLYSYGQAISSGGFVTGYAVLANNADTHAFRWTPEGGMQDLGTLGGTASFGTAINAAGQVAGNAITVGNNQTHAFRWTPEGGMQDLGTLGGTYSSAQFIDASGRVVGTSTTAGNAEQHAFRWTAAGGMQDLGGLGGTYSYAEAVNAAGYVVGYAYTSGNTGPHAVRWTPEGTIQDLGTLGGFSSVAIGIGPRGEVVGYSYLPGNATYHAFRWTPEGGMQDLGTLGGTSSYARTVNAAGQIVGGGNVADGTYHAFLWTAEDGMEDLYPTTSFNDVRALSDNLDVLSYDNRVAHVSILPNQPPIAAPLTVVTPSGTAAVTLSGTDPEGFPLTFRVIGQPAHGTLSGTAPTLTYTPEPGYSGRDSFTYLATDQKLLASAPATVTIVVGNRAPVASAGGPYVGAPGTAVPLNAAASTDPEGDALSFAWDLTGTGLYNDATGANPTFNIPTSAPVGTTYAVCVRASDEFGARNVNCASITVQQLAQTVSFTSAPPSPALVGATYSAIATASSGLPVTVSSLTPSACNVSGASVSLAAAGTCTLAANQAGNATYLAATQVTQSFTVTSTSTKAAQTSSFTSAPASPAYVGGTYTVKAAASSKLPVAVSLVATPAGVCTLWGSVSGSGISFDGEGTCTIAVDQAGNATYDAAPRVLQSITILRKPQTTPVTAPSARKVGTNYTFPATAGGSGELMVYTSLTPSVCTNSGATFSFVGIGTCSLTVDHPGNVQWAPGPQVSGSFPVIWPFTFGGAVTAPATGMDTIPATIAANVRFNLGDYRGLGVLAAGSPTVAATDCSSRADLGAEAAASGLLSYDPGTGKYLYRWTPGMPAGSCARLTLSLIDGTTHTAFFYLR